MIAICAVALIAVLLGIQMRAVRPEFGQYLTVAAVVLILTMAWGTIREVFDLFSQIGQALEVEDIYLRTLFKILGITYVAELTSGICRDAGFTALGSQLEIVGKFMVCIVSLPVFMALMTLLTELLQ